MKAYLKNPYLITVITITLFLGILRIPFNVILDNFDLTIQQSNNIDRIIKNAIIIIISIIAIRILGISKIAGLSKQVVLKDKYLLAIPMYIAVFGALSLIGTDLSSISVIDVVLLSLAMLSVGFVEEYIFRGILQSIFLKKYIEHRYGIYIGIFMPAFLFGALHLINLDMSNIAASVSQVVYAFFIGVAFGAILLKTNKLIPLAILHGLIDIVFSVNTLIDDEAIPGALEQQSAGDAIGSILFVLPLFIGGLIIIHRITKESVVAKIE